MKKYLYRFAFLTCLSFVVFTSCSKDDAGDNKKPSEEKPSEENPSKNPCLQMSAFKIEPVTPVLLGEKLQIFCDTVRGADYLWTGPGFSSYDQNPVISYNAVHFMEGWYFVKVTHDSCTTIEDSVYVDIKFPQGTPDCALTDNEVSFNGTMPKLSPAGIRNIGPGVGAFEIEAGSMNGDVYLRFSKYWIDRKLEDGIYYTTNEPFPDDEDKVNIQVVTRSLSFFAEANRPVYISYVGDKIRVAFCNIRISNYLDLHAIMTGQLTED